MALASAVRYNILGIIGSLNTGSEGNAPLRDKLDYVESKQSKKQAYLNVT